MDILSNKTIATILTIALLFSVTALIITTQKIGTPLGDKINQLTGAASASASGTASVNVSANTQITNQVSAVNFGTGYVNQTCSTCETTTDGYQKNGSCCFGFTNVTTGFLLENTGNINLSVNYTCAGNCTAALLIGGTSPAFRLRATANSVAAQSGETGTADTIASCENSYTNFAAYTDVNTTGNYFCGNSTVYSLDYNDTKDAFVVDINISIPSDAPPATGQKTATFTFHALSSG